MKPQLLTELKTYKKKNIFSDVLAGLMVAIIALPLSIALGIQSVPEAVSNHGIQYGIVTAIVAGFFISLLGGSKYQIGGPTAAFVVILFGYLSDENIGILGLALAGVGAGVILILLGLFRCGNVMRFFPYPITIGFTTGIGLTLIVGQIKDFLGLTNITGSSAIEKLVSYAKNIGTFDLGTFIVGVVGLAIVIILPKINKKIPASFVALVVCTLVCLLINGAFGGNVQTIGSRYGDIKAGFYLPSFNEIGSVRIEKLILPSIVIAFLCAIESLLSATVAAGLTNTNYDANQELIGQGVANIASSLLGGLPATGAIARTAAGIENGAKSPLTGIFHALFLLAMYFLLMNVIKYVPLAVFSSILISVAINMSRFPLFISLTKFGVKDCIVLAISCALTFVLDLTYGVLSGVAVALIFNIRYMIKKNEMTSEDNVIKADGGLNFISVNKLLSAMEEKYNEYQEVVVDMTKVEYLDSSSLEKIVKFNKKIKANGKSMELVGYNDKIRKTLDNYFKKF